MMTTFTKTHFVIAVPNLQSSADFYSKVLGFKVRTIAAWGMREFGLRTADGHRIMFGAPNHAA